MKRYAKLSAGGLLPAILLAMPAAHAEIQGIGATGDCDSLPGLRAFSLTAKAEYIELGDGTSLLAWGYSDGSGAMQYPGPTLIVCQGDTVTITLQNALPDYNGVPNPTSLDFPGQTGVTSLDSVADPGGIDTASYSFVASEPGTYMYQSGTEAELQIEMGLSGALIVRPAGYQQGDATGAAGLEGHDNRTAYGSASSQFDREYLFFLTEMDRNLHDAVDQNLAINLSDSRETLWFINGRNGPDTMHRDFAGWLPHQPYGALAQMKPAERTLLRLVGAGRQIHPFHHHGNNAWIIAQDGREYSGAAAPQPDFQHDWLLGTNRPGAVLPDSSVSNYTIQVGPGSTYDALWTWTGAGMGWDFYGHGVTQPCGAALATEEDAYHCLPLPGGLVLPEQQSLTFGGLWTGSPYLGGDTALPPGEGGLNPNLGFSFIWHSHTERELTNDDVFPGGMMTFMIVEAPGTCLAGDPIVDPMAVPPLCP